MASKEIVSKVLEVAQLIGLRTIKNGKSIQFDESSLSGIIKNGVVDNSEIETMSKEEQTSHKQEDVLLIEVYINPKSYGSTLVPTNREMIESIYQSLVAI